MNTYSTRSNSREEAFTLSYTTEWILSIIPGMEGNDGIASTVKKMN